MQYGLPQRSAVQDANEGKINPPALKRDTSVATSTATKQLSDVHLEELDIGQELGNVLGGFISQHAEDLYAKQKLQVATRKGLDEGINLVDKTNKRTGFMEAVFGQHAGYREAQQRAVETRVNKDYIRVQAELDNYAGSDPVDFHKQVIEPKLTELADLYKDDPETRELAETAFIDTAQKLIKQQQADYIAYGVQQERETTMDQMNVAFDVHQTEASKMTDPVEVADSEQKIIKKFMSLSKGATEVATKSMQTDIILNQIKNGNIGLYNLVQKSGGWADSISPSQKAQIDQAIVHYDSDLIQEASLLQTQTEAELYAADSVEGVDAILSVFDTNAQKIEDRSSGSVTSQQGLLKSEFGITKSGDARKAKIEKLRQQGLEAVTEKQREKEDLELATQALLDPDMAVTYREQTGKELKGEIRDKALNNALFQSLRATMGVEAPLDERSLRYSINKPDVYNTILPVLDKLPETPSVIKHIVNDFMDNPEYMYDELGQPNMTSIDKAIPIMRQLMGNNRISELTQDQQLEFAFMEKNLNAGVPLAKLEERKRVWADNKSKPLANLKDYAFVEEGDTYDRDKVITDRLDYIGIKKPTPEDILEYEKLWRLGMQATNYQDGAASDYVKTLYQNNSERFGDTTIRSTTTYARAAKVSVSQSLKNVAADKLNPDAIARLKSLDPHGEGNFSAIKGLDIKMNNKEKFMTIRSAGSIKPVVITFDELQKWNSDSIKNKRRQKAVTDKANGIMTMDNIADWLSFDLGNKMMGSGAKQKAASNIAQVRVGSNIKEGVQEFGEYLMDDSIQEGIGQSILDAGNWLATTGERQKAALEKKKQQEK